MMMILIVSVGNRSVFFNGSLLMACLLDVFHGVQSTHGGAGAIFIKGRKTLASHRRFPPVFLHIAAVRRVCVEDLVRTSQEGFI
jgi:hypothetical protein